MQRYHIAFATLGLIALPSAWYGYNRTVGRSAHSETVPLHIHAEQNRLVVQWEQYADQLRQADQGRLHILDGGKAVDLPLSTGQLRSGSTVYIPLAERVDMTLEADRHATPILRASGVYLSPLPASSAKKDVSMPLAAVVSTAVAPEGNVTQEMARLQQDLSNEQARNRRLQALVTELQSRQVRTRQVSLRAKSQARNKRRAARSSRSRS